MPTVEWRRDRCVTCNGAGLIPAYSSAGFEGPRECGHCVFGTVWVTPRDRLVLYPGGPIVGYQPGRYAALATQPAGVIVTDDDGGI